ncbi:MAG: sugar phosphate nucleotidyltransferase [Clostridia bacterium]
MKKPVLVIMAAGLGSRYGGLKQIAPVDDAGHIIMDYSIFDAVRAGFDEVVCVVKPEHEADFRQTIGSRVGGYARIRYAHQTLEQLPDGFCVPDGRTKPWGTAHAVLCAKHLIDGPFAVINADDFYGRDAYQVLYDYLSQPHPESAHAMVGYAIENTLTDNGTVARGVCAVNARGMLTGIVERTRIEPRAGGAAFTEDGQNWTFLPAGTTVSLNFWGFQHAMLDEIEQRFSGYLTENLPLNPLKCEYFLPLIPNQLIEEGTATVQVLPSDAKWYGVTYKEDMPELQAAIARMKLAGAYPERLWD